MPPTYKISQSLIDHYATGPSTGRTSDVKKLHEDIREALDNWADKDFDTFLQGSYRNGTAIADINDVDIVALYDPWSSPVSHQHWEWLFNHVADILRKTALVSGAVTLGDKCVKLKGALKADIVPAISRTAYSSTDPIKIYSREEREERENYPRTHYDNGVTKQANTKEMFKPTVRIFKRWVRQYPGLVAPSFYIECTVHSVASSKFNTYIPRSFADAANEILGYTQRTRIPTVARDKDILVPGEWSPSDFSEFQQKLRRDVNFVLRAMSATTTAEANRLWKSAFGD
ncbi:MAG: hypothetical protein M3R63_19845 [Actinomycetota bacterium]|nr:hypothetical protein [Actinomycetota bacterium]